MAQASSSTELDGGDSYRIQDVDFSPYAIAITASFTGPGSAEIKAAIQKCHTWAEFKVCVVRYYTDPEKRAEFMHRLFRAVNDDAERAQLGCSFLRELAYKNNLDFGIDMSDFAEKYKAFNESANAGDGLRKRLVSSAISLADAWGTTVLESGALGPALMRENAAKALVTLSKVGYTWDSCAASLNAAVVQRLTRSSVGVRHAKHIMAGDARAAALILKESKGSGIPTGSSKAKIEAAAKDLGLSKDAHGLYYPTLDEPTLLRMHQSRISSAPVNAPPPPGASVETPTALSSAVVRRDSSSISPPARMPWQRQSQSIAYRPAVPGTPPPAPTETITPGTEVVSPLVRSTSATLFTSTPRRPPPPSSSDTRRHSSQGTPPPRHRRISQTIEQARPPPPPRQRPTSQSSASELEQSESSAAWEDLESSFAEGASTHRKKVDKARAAAPDTLLPDCACLKHTPPIDRTLIAEMDLIMKTKQVIDDDRVAAMLVRYGTGMTINEDNMITSHYCNRHIRDMASIAGLQIKSLTNARIIAHLWNISRSHGELARAKAHPSSYEIYRKGRRPPLPQDALGVFRWFPTKAYKARLVTDLRTALSDNQHHRLKVLSGLTDNQIKEFKAEGTINVNMFQWWQKQKLTSIFDAEFELYDWHQREWMGRPNRGWLRTMIHSLAQQLMRQDISYWAAYVLLRDDHLTWLTSYPYYAKKTMSGDQTFFRHIDLNPYSMVHQGRGVHQIQGSLSLDDEVVENCTTIVKKMHLPNNINEWSKRLIARKVSNAANVLRIDDKNLTEQDLKDFKTKWSAVPCKALQVRISDPRLPHGSSGPATRMRRTMLPWFCGIAPDHVNLEVKEGATWNEISQAHRDLLPAPRSPSGKGNNYGPVPFAFPGAARLRGLGPISDALIAQRKWTDPEVVYKLHFLLNLASDEELRVELQQFQRKAKDAVVAAWELVKEMEEKHFYDVNSFFAEAKKQGNKNMKAGKWKRPAPDAAEADKGNDSELEDEFDNTLDMPMSPNYDI